MSSIYSAAKASAAITMKRNRHRKEQLWLTIRFPSLPLNSQGLNDAVGAAFVKENNVVICTNHSARQLGIKDGMPLSTASLLGPCQHITRSKTLEALCLQNLAQALYQFTPYIQECIQPTQSGLQLEISHCLILFKGLCPLTQKLSSLLDSSGYNYQLGLAHTAKASWLLSFQAHTINGQENKTVFIQRLQNIDIDVLHNFSKAIERLKKSGFHCLGDLLKQVQTSGLQSLSKRFGQPFANELCDIFALSPSFRQDELFQTPAPTFTPKDPFFERIAFDHPVIDSQYLLPAMEQLLKNLSNYLRHKNLESQSIEWRFFDIHQQQNTLFVRCDDPQVQAPLFYELSRIKLEQSPPPFAVDTIELVCEQTQSVQNRDQYLPFLGEKNPQKSSSNFALLTAKLQARLGDHALSKISYCDDHVPELSVKRIKLSETSHQQLPDAQQRALRPSWLFETPQVIQQTPSGLHWHGMLHILSAAERIESHWWDQPVARDYYFAQREDQLNFWVYWDGHQRQWYVHGIFS